jgi:hypothetical protein
MMLHVIRILLPLMLYDCLFLSIAPNTRHRSRLIDFAVNNAGYALVGPFEDSSKRLVISA